MIKNLIQKLGDKLIPFVAIFAYLAVLVQALPLMNHSWTFMLGLFVLVGGAISVTVFFYLLYAFMDMRDSLRDIRESLKN